MQPVFWDGSKISKPGLFAGIDMDSYQSDLCVGPSISSGGLRLIESKSLKHYYAKSYLNDDEDADEDEAKESEALVFGRAVHHLFGAEPQFFDHFDIRPDEYPDGAVYPDTDGEKKKWNANSNWCKGWLAERKAEHKSVLTKTQMKRIRLMAKALAETDEAREGMFRGLVEHSLVWQDKITGVWLKARPDLLIPDSAIVLDFKTTLDASWLACSKAVTQHGYHIQLGLIDMGVRALEMEPTQDFYLTWLEKRSPFCAVTRPVDNIDIDYGRRQTRRAIDEFAWALERNEWPAYRDSERPVTLQDFRRKQLAKEAEEKTLPIVDLG